MPNHEPLQPFRDDLPGDDQPFYTLRYSDVPTGYRITDLTVDSTKYPLLAAAKSALDTFAERYYKNYEIVGVTVAEFHEHMQDALEMKLATFESFLKKHDDLAVASTGSTVIFTPTTKVTSRQLTDSVTENIDVPLDDPTDEAPATKSKTNAGSSETENSGTDTTVIENADFNTLKEFIRSNASIPEEYIMIFRDCFMNRAAYTW